MTVIEVCRALSRHPIHEHLHRWNWKNALFTGLVRGALFFATNLVDGWSTAVRVLAVDALFRVPLSGVYAAITQALAGAQPRWASLAIVVGLVPAFGHAVEIVVHWLMHTPELRTSVIVSVAFSAASSLFNLFSMERGVFLVGAGARPFAEDVRRLPHLLVEFAMVPGRAARRLRAAPRAFLPTPPESA
jgi:hypothetical protein